MSVSVDLAAMLEKDTAGSGCRGFLPKKSNISFRKNLMIMTMKPIIMMMQTTMAKYIAQLVEFFFPFGESGRLVFLMGGGTANKSKTVLKSHDHNTK